jgi:hypothetical protein
MFEKRKPDSLRIRVFEEIGLRHEADYGYRCPSVRGLAGWI